MDFLWSPWRFQFIANKDKQQSCIFCDKPQLGNDAETLIVHRSQLCFVILNLYPYNNGHVMIAPYAHVPTLEDADETITSEMMRLTRATQMHLRKIYAAPGFNIGMNLGACAGAGVAGHIHMHVLPRWPGDANFMTTVAETRILPEDLETSFQRLKDAFAAH